MTILNFMEKLNYQIADYNVFSINEIDAMFMNSQLDMLLTHATEDKKVYIKYYFSAKAGSGQIRPQYLDTIIEDLYDIENVLTKKDTLVIIIDEEPNDTIINKMKYLYERSGIFVVIHNIKRLQFNILEHKLIPVTSILAESEIAEFQEKYKLKSLQQLPTISRFDPLALALMMRPGQVAKFVRNSATALETKTWRICV
jgi:DNA-directed RNA polymerase subunit H (RpoH/RPB5)